MLWEVNKFARERRNRRNKQAGGKLKMNLVNKFVINDFPKRLLIAHTNQKAYRISFKDVFCQHTKTETTAKAI